jgi:hypothetical protein
VGVTLQASLGDTVAGLVTGAACMDTFIRPLSKPTSSGPKFESLQVPDDENFVTRTGQKHVRVLEGRGQGLFGFPSAFIHPLTLNSQISANLQ